MATIGKVINVQFILKAGQDRVLFDKWLGRVKKYIDLFDGIQENGPDFTFGLRPALRDFAVEMETKLRKHDHKTTWRDRPIEALVKLLLLEIEEFKVALEFFEVRDARQELIDVANYCMIVSDRLSLLDQGKTRVEQDK